MLGAAVASLPGVALLGMLAVGAGCQDRSSRETGSAGSTPAAPSTPDVAPGAPTPAALSAARIAFSLPEGAPVDVWTTGDGTEGIARDTRTKICAVLYTSADGAWHEHTKFRGEPNDAAMTPPPRGPATMQTGVTANDLRLLATTNCK